MGNKNRPGHNTKRKPLRAQAERREERRARKHARHLSSKQRRRQEAARHDDTPR